MYFEVRPDDKSPTGFSVYEKRKLLYMDLSSGLVYYPGDPQVFLEGRIIRKNFFFFGGMQLTEQNFRYYIGVRYRLFYF